MRGIIPFLCLVEHQSVFFPCSPDQSEGKFNNQHNAENSAQSKKEKFDRSCFGSVAKEAKKKGGSLRLLQKLRLGEKIPRIKGVRQNRVGDKGGSFFTPHKKAGPFNPFDHHFLSCRDEISCTLCVIRGSININSS